MTGKDVLLRRNIECEKAYTDFIFSAEDAKIAHDMIQEINTFGYDFHYLAEIESYRIPNSGHIILKYINKFSEEATRAYLVAQLVSDRVKNCDRIVLQLYSHFKLSSAYISEPNMPAPAHIYVRYDNAFKELKPKRLAKDLVGLAYHPRDAFYLPSTIQMLASWKISEVKELLISYLEGSTVTAQSVGICDNAVGFYPSLESIKRELKFTAINGLKYYPSDETISLIRQCALDTDSDIRIAAKKTLKIMEKASKRNCK